MGRNEEGMHVKASGKNEGTNRGRKNMNEEKESGEDPVKYCIIKVCDRSMCMRSARERHLLVEQLLLKKPSYILPCRSVRSPQQINTTSAQRKVGLSAQTSSGLRKDTTVLLPSHSHTSRRPCRASITATCKPLQDLY